MGICGESRDVWVVFGLEWRLVERKCKWGSLGVDRCGCSRWWVD